MSDRLLTIKESAGYLKVHWQTVRNYIQQGRLRAVKAGKNVRILESDLKQFLDMEEKSVAKNEIEIRFLTSNRKQIEENLIRLGAKVVFQGHVIDHYYVYDNVKNISQKNEDYESGRGIGLRIREQDNGYTGKVVTTLENKRLVVPYRHDTCFEVEIGVDNYEDTNKLLYSLNLKEFATLDKDRLVYKLGEAKVVIDDIRDYKTGVEVEMVTAESSHSVLPRLRRLAEQIGLDVTNELVDKSVTYLYMQEFSKF